MSSYTSYGSGDGGGGGSSFAFCFSGDTRVRLANGEMKRMDELQLNEWVMSANASRTVYSSVESWIHRLPAKPAKFHRLQLSDDRVLKLTAKHFIYKRECSGRPEDERISFDEIPTEPVFADQVLSVKNLNKLH